LFTISFLSPVHVQSSLDYKYIKYFINQDNISHNKNYIPIETETFLATPGIEPMPESFQAWLYPLCCYKVLELNIHNMYDMDVADL
jgi:hypothetical protein